MKRIKYLYQTLFFIAVIGLSACENFDLEDNGIILEELPGYVSFNGQGASTNLDTVVVAENTDGLAGGTDRLNIENPTGTLSDITVSFELSGSAVFGTDFTIDNATVSGTSGTIVLPNDVSDVNAFNNVDFDVVYLTDGVADGDKILTITLTSAVNMDGEEFAIGRGGLDILRSGTILIEDID